jgi:hypothetical protein
MPLRFSFALLVAVLLMGGLFAFHQKEEAFSQAREIEWTGAISRIFVSGEALEVRSSDAPGGVFHAYMPDRQVSPVTDGTVRIHGLWRGYTCDYGIRCVPEVDIISVQ